MFYKNRKSYQEWVQTDADRGNVWTQQEGRHPQEAPGETNPTGTLITDFQTPEP